MVLSSGTGVTTLQSSNQKRRTAVFSRLIAFIWCRRRDSWPTCGQVNFRTSSRKLSDLIKSSESQVARYLLVIIEREKLQRFLSRALATLLQDAFLIGGVACARAQRVEHCQLYLGTCSCGRSHEQTLSYIVWSLRIACRRCMPSSLFSGL